MNDVLVADGGRSFQMRVVVVVVVSSLSLPVVEFFLAVLLC